MKHLRAYGVKLRAQRYAAPHRRLADRATDQRCRERRLHPRHRAPTLEVPVEIIESQLTCSGIPAQARHKCEATAQRAADIEHDPNTVAARFDVHTVDAFTGVRGLGDQQFGRTTIHFFEWQLDRHRHHESTRARTETEDRKRAVDIGWFGAGYHARPRVDDDRGAEARAGPAQWHDANRFRIQHQPERVQGVERRRFEKAPPDGIRERAQIGRDRQRGVHLRREIPQLPVQHGLHRARRIDVERRHAALVQ